MRSTIALMPELPEVETVRQSLADQLIGQRVKQVRLYRHDVIRSDQPPTTLLRGQCISEIRRHGKELVLVTKQRRCVLIHLGMSGVLQLYQPNTPSRGNLPPHTHIVWTLAGGSRLAFRDPRRFGGIWCFPSPESLWENRWQFRGPDALIIDAYELHSRLSRTIRPIKAALLDQSLIAGLGNIYVDELLFDCRLHPTIPAARLSLNQVRGIIRPLRSMLRRAIAAGGSTTRDYVDGNGRKGRFREQHRVYGRKGKPCVNCANELESTQISGRRSVYCPQCQASSKRTTTTGSG